MPRNAPAGPSAARHLAPTNDLLLRETNHRCSNDLQMIIGLLSLQSRRAVSAETRRALDDAIKRVSVLARARRVFHGDSEPSLSQALRETCEALHAQAEPRDILISLRVENDGIQLPAQSVTVLALVTNELATNAIKHAFAEGVAGRIDITLRQNGEAEAVVLIDDDGLPFPDPSHKHEGLGWELTRRLMALIGGLFIPPPQGLKVFEMRVPLDTA
jgi:two-component sensor histidine kinase